MAAGVRRVVDDRLGALGVRAVRTTIEGAVRLDAVPDHFAAAVLAHGGQLLDGALEAVEVCVCPAVITWNDFS